MRLAGEPYEHNGYHRHGKNPGPLRGRCQLCQLVLSSTAGPLRGRCQLCQLVLSSTAGGVSVRGVCRRLGRIMNRFSPRGWMVASLGPTGGRWQLMQLLDSPGPAGGAPDSSCTSCQRPQEPPGRNRTARNELCQWGVSHSTRPCPARPSSAGDLQVITGQEVGRPRVEDTGRGRVLTVAIGRTGS